MQEKETGAAVASQVLNQCAASTGVAPDSAQRFRERSHVKINFGLKAEVFRNAASIRPTQERGVRFVNHHARAMTLCDGDDLRKAAKVAAIE